MNNVPLISVVMPSYNQGHFIEEAITSVLGQDYPHKELIVMDGGSTDETVEVLRRYDRHLAYWQSTKDGGQANAINLGFQRARGQVLCWLNSDDMYLPCALTKVMRAIGDVQRPALVFGGCLHFTEGAVNGFAALPDRFERERLTYADDYDQPSTFWTRALWEQTGPLDESYHFIFDWDWFIRASRICDFTRLGAYLSIYRAHSSHKTGTGGDRRQQEVMRLTRQYADAHWRGVYEDVAVVAARLRQDQEKLNRFRVPRLRYLLYRKLYARHGANAVETALNMLRPSSV
ncbi:MAG: glycosyltransferase family 2 protein [Myxococcota bacterium]